MKSKEEILSNSTVTIPYDDFESVCAELKKTQDQRDELQKELDALARLLGNGVKVYRDEIHLIPKAVSTIEITQNSESEIVQKLYSRLSRMQKNSI